MKLSMMRKAIILIIKKQIYRKAGRPCLQSKAPLTKGCLS